MEEMGNLPRQQASPLDVVFGQKSVEVVRCLDRWQKSDLGSHRCVEGTSLLVTVPVFLQSGLEKLQLTGEAFLFTVHRSCKKGFFYVIRMVIDSESGKGLCG